MKTVVPIPMIVSSIFSLFLLGISGLLLDSHRRARMRMLAVDGLDNNRPDKGALRFANSQYRRRMLASGTIGVIGAAIAIRPLVPAQPVPMTLYLLLLVSACGWVLLLALVDMLATGVYYRRLRGQYISAEAKLAHELKMVRENDG